MPTPEHTIYAPMRSLLTRHKATRPVHILKGVGGRIALFFVFLLTLSVFPTRAQVDAETVINLGRNALSVDDYLTAMRYFNQAIEAKPFLSKPYYYRAYAKFTLEDYHGAEADCDRSIKLNPFIVEVYQLRALCRIHNDDFRGAINDYDRTLRELPNDQGARYNRTLCYLQLKDYEKANSDIDYLLQKWPSHTRTYMLKAQALLEQKDTLLALQAIDTLLLRQPSEAGAWAFKGSYLMKQERWKEADSCLSRAIALRPTDFELYVNRALTRHQLNRFGLAIADYDRILELQPQHFVAHYNRGLLRSFVGDLNRAIDDFDFILSVEPDNTLARYNRARLHQQIGNFRGAISDYSVLIKAYPQFTAGYLARAECRRAIGDNHGALADETYVARRNLDLAFGKARPGKARKVRLRSNHELDQYQQLVEEDADTTRNVFGRLYGKVQNEKADTALLSLFGLRFRSTFRTATTRVGFMPEVARMKSGNTADRELVLTATPETTAEAGLQTDEDAIRLTRYFSEAKTKEQWLITSAIDAARYDYESALREAREAIRLDSTSVAARLHHSALLVGGLRRPDLSPKEQLQSLARAEADLRQARSLDPENPYVSYNLGCLYAAMGKIPMALRAFDEALRFDSRLAEASYNRAMLLSRSSKLEDHQRAVADFSRAGALGLHQAYAQLKRITK